MSGELHAFLTSKCFCPLDNHLLNTMLAVNETSLSRRLANIALRVGGRDKKDLYYNYLLLPFILHDIGKAIELYQKNLLNHSYYYHEVFGALITFKIIKEYLFDKKELDAIDIKKLVPLIVYPVLYHHYAMRDIERLVDVDKSKYEKIVRNREYLVIKTAVLSELLDKLGIELNRYNIVKSSKGIDKWILPDILRGLSKVVSGFDDPLDFSRIDKQFLFLQKKMNEEYFGYLSGQGLRELIEIHISSLTGLVNIADYLVSSIERKPCQDSARRGFVYQILSEDEIRGLADKLVICRRI